MFNGTDELEEFVCSSGTALELKFVHSQDDFFNNDLAFKPVYTHQVFGENEKIYGYKNLKIKLYYTSDHLDTFLGITYDDKVEPHKHKGTKPDDIFKAILECIPDGYIINQDQFLAQLIVPRPFIPFGDLLHVHVGGDGQRYEIYKVDISAAGFKEYHARLQTFILWFIDGASFIEIDDEKWSFYLIYEKTIESGGSTHYSITGYATVYSYYAYPDKIRPRISQMLIMPPYQRKGLGGQLLQTIYNDLVADKDVLDITVEDPSPEFTALRDYIDCRNVLKLSSFQPSCLLQSYSPEMEREFQEKLKLHKNQCRKVYEILRLKVTDRSDIEQYRQYRLLVKNRLNGPYQKQQRDLERLQRLGLDQTELVAAAPLITKEERMRLLHEEYERIENEYRTTIEKLATDY